MQFGGLEQVVLLGQLADDLLRGLARDLSVDPMGVGARARRSNFLQEVLCGPLELLQLFEQLDGEAGLPGLASVFLLGLLLRLGLFLLFALGLLGDLFLSLLGLLGDPLLGLRLGLLGSPLLGALLLGSPLLSALAIARALGLFLALEIGEGFEVAFAKLVEKVAHVANLYGLIDAENSAELLFLKEADGDSQHVLLFGVRWSGHGS